MEYLSGGDLSQRIKLGLDVPGALAHTRAIAEGLDVIHRAGIVHRDLKPRNILFRGTGELVIADFGAAHFARHDDKPVASGLVVGTPAYMSPEQCLGQRPDARSDLYSLGILLFEMLTGMKPFRRPELDALLADHVTTPPPPLPSALEGLQPLLDGLLAKAPGERFQSAAELLAGLDWIGSTHE
jgi:serine/threonine protein kinase